MASLLLLLAVGGGSCADEPTGLRIDVDLNGRKPDTIRVFVSAAPDGFGTPGGSGKDGITISTEPDDAGVLGLVLLFKSPAFDFGPKFSFQLETKNPIDLTMTASALGFAADKLNSGADKAWTTLPAGGRSTIVLTLGDRTGIVVPTTHTTDLSGANANLTVKGAWKMGHLTSLASCNVNGLTGADDIVIGAPASPDSRMLGAVGAVHVVLGETAAAEIDLETAPASQEFHFYGAAQTDELGASVACTDVDGDGIGDIIAGAPGANGGMGRVYIVFGRPSIATSPINLGGVPPVGTNIFVWESQVAGSRFGDKVHALPEVRGVHPAQILIAAPGAKLVHLLPPPTKPTGIQTANVMSTQHPMISGVEARALAMGRFTGLRDVQGPLDVAVGDSMLHPGNDPLKQGVVYLFHAVDPASSTMFSVDAGPAIGQSLVLTGADDNSLFGHALLAIDSGFGQDLLVGAPGELNGAGKVHLYKNDSDLFAFTTKPMHDGVIDGPVANGRFGTALGVAVSGLVGGAERLVVGAPDTTQGGRPGTGAAYLFDTGARAFPLVEQVFGANANDHLGSAVAGGQVDADMKGDLIVSAPDANGSGDKTQAGVVYVKYVK